MKSRLVVVVDVMVVVVVVVVCYRVVISFICENE